MGKASQLRSGRTSSASKKHGLILCLLACIAIVGFDVFVVWSCSIPPEKLKVCLSLASGRHLTQFTVGWSLDLGRVAMAPNASNFVSASRNSDVRMWDTETGALLRTFSGHTDWVSAVAYWGEGTEIVTGSHDNTAKRWDAETAACLMTFAGHTGTVYSVAFAPDGTKVLTGSFDGSAKLWNAEDGICLWTHKPGKDVNAVAFSSDGARTLVGSDKAKVNMLDTATGACLRTFDGKTDDNVLSVASSPDGRSILAGLGNGNAIMWEAATGKCLQTFERGWLDQSFFVAFSPGGEKLIAAGRLRDVATGKSLVRLSTFGHSVESGGFSPDGTKLLVGLDSRAYLWDVSDLP